MSSKLEPVIWLRVLITLAYMKGRTDVPTENDVMAILPNFLPSISLRTADAFPVREATTGNASAVRRLPIDGLSVFS